MEIRSIDKAIYRQRLNLFMVGFFVIFAVLALVFGSLLIAAFGQPIIEGVADAEVQSNFRFNLLGVVIALALSTLLVNGFKNKPWMAEIYYIWQLKQLHNKVYRKLAKIKPTAFEGDINGIIILAFYYKTTKLVYELDNNTLTISKVNLDIKKLEKLINDKGLNENSSAGIDQLAEKFDASLIDQF